VNYWLYLQAGENTTWKKIIKDWEYYEKAVDKFFWYGVSEKLFLDFAKFEEFLKRIEECLKNVFTFKREPYDNYINR